MNYKKAYKEALERAKKELNTCGSQDCDAARQIFRFFPELAESEDERIRKALLCVLKSDFEKETTICDITVGDIIDWIEKQGEKDNWAEELNNKIKELHKQCLAKIQENNTPTIVWHSVSEEPEEMKELFCEWESDDATWHDVAFYDEESHTFRHAKMPINVTRWVYVDELLEKEVELKTPNIDEMKFKVGGAVSVYGNPLDYEHASITQKDFAPKCVNGTFQVSTKDCWWADEPKFKVGDFIVNDYCMGRVVELTDDAYLLDSGQGIPFSCHTTRLWDITKDAKDGDILVCEDNMPFIFKGFDRFHPECPVAYCGIDEKGYFIVSMGDGWWTDEEVKPATKEQCNFLFQKMHEEGYEWNSEKKELSKFVIDEGKAEMDYCFTKMMNGEKVSPAWSEEDEYNKRQICRILKDNGCSIKLQEKIEKWIEDRLKSLRPQNTWKPSGEQMEVLKDLIEDNNQRSFYPTLESLYDDLEKLKEK